MTPEPTEPTQRLFFALWPQDSEQQALARATAKATRSSGGRPVPMPNLHVTLAFVGSVPLSRVPELRAVAQRTAHELLQATPLSLHFDAVAHWPRQQLLCALAAAQSVAAAPALAGALKDAVAAAGFSPDLKPFRAHVTLARKVLHAPRRAALRAVVWHFNAFTLIASRTETSGSVYSVIESYSLVAGEKAHE